MAHNAVAKTDTRNGTARAMGFMICPPVLQSLLCHDMAQASPIWPSHAGGPHEYLVRKPKSVYKQLFIKQRWIAARTLYGMYARFESPLAPEDIAADYDLPVEA